MKSLRASVSVAVALLCLAAVAGAQEWVQLGPEGGDVRSLAYDPLNPDRIYLGTSAGALYVSDNGGYSWKPLARLDDTDHYVLDNIVVDPVERRYIYAAAWDVERQGGDLFRSSDAGKSWQRLEGMRGKSIRALAVAPSRPEVVVVGALDGVFRSRDRGRTWERISPQNHEEIRNIESLAIDPKDADIIYVGTWHLPWKTTDGGATWHWIKKGVIDDSDVFSILIDSRDTNVVYASACSGIYKSTNGGELFRKVQGIPYSARRTRALHQDPTDSNVVYAGTTEGLWKTTDAGRSWRLMTTKNLVINEVLVDPRHPQRVLLGTDRAGVLASEDGGKNFTASNRGFVHRQVAGLLVDRRHPEVIYAGVVNDKEFGGIFVSRDGGLTWGQMNDGLAHQDVFVLRQTPEGTVLAGTNSGVFRWDEEQQRWQGLNLLLEEKLVPEESTGPRKQSRAALRTVQSEFRARVSDLHVEGDTWYAASSAGLYVSTDQGQSWRGGPLLGYLGLIAVRVNDPTLVVATPTAVLVSQDRGQQWQLAVLPEKVTGINTIAIDGRSQLWIGAREGAFRSLDGGERWYRVLGGLAATNVLSIVYDDQQRRLLATAGLYKDVFESRDGGRNWERISSGWKLRELTLYGRRLLATTAFDGVVAQPAAVRRPVSAGGGQGGGRGSQE